MKQFEKISKTPFVLFLKYVYSFKEFRGALRFFLNTFRKSRGPILFDFWSSLNLRESLCLVFEVVWKSQEPLLFFLRNSKKSQVSPVGPSFGVVILRNLGDPLCFVFEVVWKNLRDFSLLVFEACSLKESRNPLDLVLGVVWKKLRNPLDFFFWSSLKEFRELLVGLVFEVIWKNLEDLFAWFLK